MNKDQALHLAKRYSDKYNAFWYVREVGDGDFQPWAHDTGEDDTVACYFLGNRLICWRDPEVTK